MTGFGAAVRRPLVLASANPGKVAEFRRLLAASAWEVIPLNEAGYSGALEEHGDTYAENALSKAAQVAVQVNDAVIADDSGIEVDALRGWPGARSARWLGGGATDSDRLRSLLEEARRRTPDDLRARYVCVVALCRPGAEPVTARGECLGRLVEPRGPKGFGYDPGFLSDDLGITFGEADDAAKDSVSHRARALLRLAATGLLGPAPDAA